MNRREKTYPSAGRLSHCLCAAAVIVLTGAAANAQLRQVWTMQPNNGLDATEVDWDVEIDSQGHIVTVGYEFDDLTDYDMLLRKHDRTGRLLWSTTFDVGGSGEDFFGNVVIDSADNIIVLGTGPNANGNTDIVTLKYAPDGTQLWVNHYDGPLSGRDEAYGWPALALDANDNVYCAGYSEAADGVIEFVTVKYDSAGVEQWVERYRGPNSGSPNSYGWCLAVTPAGDVYVAGGARNVQNNSDYVLLKYDTSGTLLWERLFDGENGGSDGVYTVVVDAAENIFLAGISDSQYLNNDFEYCVAKYASDGTFQWEGRYGGDYGFHYGWVAEPDDAGGVYVSGASMSSGGQYDIATVRFDTNGATAWAQRFGQPRWFGDDWGYYLDRDADGNVLVCGYGWNGPGQGNNGYLLKYSPSGQLLEEINYDGPLHGDEWFTAVAVDDAGRIVVVGFTIGLGTGADAFVAKYTLAAAPELILSPDPPVAGQSATFSVTDMEPLSECYLAYSLAGSSNVFVPFLNVTLSLQNPKQAGNIKVSDAAGTVVWQLPIPGNTAGMDVWFQSVQYNQVSNVVATQIE